MSASSGRRAIKDLETKLLSDKYVSRWLKSRKPNTRRHYMISLRLFLEFSKKVPEELVMEKWHDTQKLPPEQTDVAEHRLASFHKWLLEEYKKTGKYAKRGGAELAPLSASTRVGAVQSFYTANGVPLVVKKLGVRGVFSANPKKENQSMKMSPEQVEKLAYYAPTLRDKALVWFLFQTGMDISIALRLDWRDIAEEFENPPLTKIEYENGDIKEIPSVLLDVTRDKAGGKEFRTYITATAINMLRKYLVEKHGEDFAKKMQYKEPLFIGRNEKKRFRRQAFEQVLLEVAPKTELVKKERLALASKNPLRPAALRASFSDALKGVRCDPDYIDYWMGHVSRYGGAYSSAERTDYCKFAYLALEPKGASPELERKLREQNQRLLDTSENITKLTLSMIEKDKKMADVEQRLEAVKDLEKAMQDIVPVYQAIIQVFGKANVARELKRLLEAARTAVLEEEGAPWIVHAKER
jgi:integrase